MDPYDYDTILFILNLVKELSQETASTVDKVWNQLIVASGQLPSLCGYDFCTWWFKRAASRLNRVELSKDVLGHNDPILRRFWGPRHLLQSWKTRTYGIVVEMSFFLVNLPWQTSLVFFSCYRVFSYWTTCISTSAKQYQPVMRDRFILHHRILTVKRWGT